MLRRERPISERGAIGDMLSLTAGSLVVGLCFAFAGPFISVLMGIASGVYGTTVMLTRFMTTKEERDNLRGWG